MEHQRKRTRSVYHQQPSQASESTTVTTSILDQFPIQDDSLVNTLVKLDQDITTKQQNQAQESDTKVLTLQQINQHVRDFLDQYQQTTTVKADLTTKQKKKHVTLSHVNAKVDKILQILNSTIPVHHQLDYEG